MAFFNDHSGMAALATIVICVLLTLLSLELFTEPSHIDKKLNTGDSAFYPLHTIFTSITVAIFGGILYMIYKIQEAGKEKSEKWLLFFENETIREIVKTIPDGENMIKKMKEKTKSIKEKDSIPIIGLDAGAAAGLGALVLSLGIAFLANFIQTPILDYEIPLIYDNTTTQYRVSVNNYGNAPAKNVLMDFRQNNTDFESFDPQPFISKHFKANTSKDLGLGKGFVEIDTVPAFSRTDIITNVNTENHTKNDILSVKIRSDETIGKRNTLSIALYYLSLLFVFMIIPMLFWGGKIGRWRENFVGVLLFVIQGVVLGIILVSFYYRQ